MHPARTLSRTAILCLITLVLFNVSSVASQPQPSPAVAAAQIAALYGFHFAHDMAFSRRGVQVRSAWLSPRLHEACLSYFGRRVSPDEVPAIDGDPFTNSQEYPQSFRVGTPAVSRSTALVPVTLRWPDGHTGSLSVVLVVQGDTWLVDDIEYPQGPSLRKLLERKP
jgi:hypothetical protein